MQQFRGISLCSFYFVLHTSEFVVIIKVEPIGQKLHTLHTEILKYCPDFKVTAIPHPPIKAICAGQKLVQPMNEVSYINYRLIIVVSIDRHLSSSEE